jgi:hemerythrin-like metal-binding protein
MDFIEMGYEFFLDVPELDKQHKELVRQLNEAIKHCTGKKADEKLFYDKNTRNSIDFLKNHFETEERYLCKTKYDNLKKHKSEHKKILDDIIKMNNDIEKKKVALDLFYVTAFIKERVMKHIRTYDLTAKKYFSDGYAQ